MKNKLGIILVLMIAFAMSCSEDFLIEKPKSFLSPENVLVDATGLQTVLNTAIKGVYNQWHGDNEELMFNHNMSDASVVSCTDKQNAFVDLVRYATPLNSRDNDAARHRSFYVENYRQIKSCNTVIDYIDIPEWDGGTSDPERNHLLGTAYFLRAFFYMQLTMDFGNVAFPLNVVSEARQDFKAFHMQGIWDQMIVDLEYAVEWMKPKSGIVVGQPPKAAAQMLLAKYYMLNEQFAEAEAEMDDVIASSEHRLFTDADVDRAFVRVGNNVNPNTGEVILGRDCNVPADAINLLHMNEGSQRVTNPEGIWMLTNTPFIEGRMGRSARIRAWGPNFVSTNKGLKAPPTGAVSGCDIKQDGKSHNMVKWGRSQGFASSTNYANEYIWVWNNGINDSTDYRHKEGNYFRMEYLWYDNPDLEDTEWWQKPAQKFYNGILLCEDSVRCWYDYPLYKFYAENIEQRLDRMDGGAQDMYIMRKAEAYLIRAEARFWQGDNAGAAEDLNVLRNRANCMFTYTAGDIANEGIGAILDERCREMFGEEYRHDEMVRMSVIFAKTNKTCYNGNTYGPMAAGSDYEKHLSAGSFYYDRMMEKNDYFRERTYWATYTDISYTIAPKHIFWPVYENYLVGNVGAVLNQTTGYDGAEKNIEPLVHQVQTPGAPNIDPQEALGE